MDGTYYKKFLAAFNNDRHLAYDSDAANIASHFLDDPKLFLVEDPAMRGDLEQIFVNLELPIPIDQTMGLALTAYLDAQTKIQNEDNAS
jgi:hypothetical protein